MSTYSLSGFRVCAETDFLRLAEEAAVFHHNAPLTSGWEPNRPEMLVSDRHGTSSQEPRFIWPMSWYRNSIDRCISWVDAPIFFFGQVFSMPIQHLLQANLCAEDITQRNLNRGLKRCYRTFGLMLFRQPWAWNCSWWWTMWFYWRAINPRGRSVCLWRTGLESGNSPGRVPIRLGQSPENK